MITEFANAKINLFLDVVGVREDGFHNIKSVMHSISLCDKLTIEAFLSDKTEIEIAHNSLELSNDKDNLIYKSALKYLAEYGFDARVKITLEKNIPIGAGLGGGSADAAATLRGLNRIFGFADNDALIKLSCKIGSDVPFCLIGGTAMCEGRGEILTPLNIDFNRHFVVAIGDSRVSTPKAYRDLDERFNYNFANRSNNEPDFETLYNVFEEVITIPEIDEIKKNMTKNGAEQTLMSGSGPSVFGIFKNEETARLAVDALQKLGFKAYYAASAEVSKVDSI